MLEFTDRIIRSDIPSPPEQPLFGRPEKAVMEPLANGSAGAIVPAPERRHIVEAGKRCGALGFGWSESDRPCRKLDQLRQSRMRNGHGGAGLGIREEPAAQVKCR